jgi:hypothetical protein
LEAYWVNITVTPVIDEGRKSAVIIFEDINAVPTLQLSKIYKEVDDGYINDWADRRGLHGASRPDRQPWNVVIRNLRGVSCFSTSVKDQKGWEGVMSYLRQKRQAREKKICYDITIDGHFITYERNKTPPPIGAKEKLSKS